MSLKFITLAALGVASHALGSTADTYWKGMCIKGQPSNIGGTDGPEIATKSSSKVMVCA